MIQRIKNTTILLIGSAVIGAVLLTLSFCLPVAKARQNVEASLECMIEVGEDGSEWRKFVQNRRENFTDSLMVQNALEKIEGKSSFSHAMYIYHYDLQNETTWTPEASLSHVLTQGSEGMHLLEYSKYWHGYLIFLKPLLMVMTWEGVEVFNILFQVFLLGAVIVVAFRRKEALLGLGMVVTLIYMKPLYISVSLAMSACWYIILLGVLFQLLFYERLKEKKLFESFFLCIGIMTAYMDFLTYPIATLGIPLCVYIVLSVKDTGVWQMVKDLFWMTALWGVGYVGMWSMKWVLAEATLQTGTLRNAVWSVIYRGSPLDGYGSYLSGISRMMKLIFIQYDSVWYWIGIILIFTGVLSALTWAAINGMKKKEKEWIKNLVFLVLVSLLPFAWLILTQNHSAIHCVFTFRVLGVVVFALWCAGICAIKSIRAENQSNPKKTLKNA